MLKPLGPQPARRPKIRRGTHTPGDRPDFLELACNGEQARVWWTAAGIRCVSCWHLLEPGFSTPLEDALHKRFRWAVSQRNNLVADDFDDSETGLRQMADQIHAIHPYLRLQTAARRAQLFRIASFQHSIIALDGAADIAPAMRIARTLEAKLTTELDALLKAAIK